MPAINPRWIYLFVLLSCAGLLGYALYAQHVDGLHPCPLCITQRAFFALAGFFALMGLIFNPVHLGRYVANGLMLLSCIGGGAVAYRQVWLQGLPPDQVPACGPSLEYMFDNLPFAEACRTLMMGDGNCAEVVWTFWGLSMPTWSLIWFCALGLLALFNMLITPKAD